MSLPGKVISIGRQLDVYITSSYLANECTKSVAAIPQTRTCCAFV